MLTRIHGTQPVSVFRDAVANALLLSKKTGRT